MGKTKIKKRETLSEDLQKAFKLKKNPQTNKIEKFLTKSNLERKLALLMLQFILVSLFSKLQEAYLMLKYKLILQVLV